MNKGKINFGWTNIKNCTWRIDTLTWTLKERLQKTDYWPLLSVYYVPNVYIFLLLLPVAEIKYRYYYLYFLQLRKEA